MSRRWEAQLFYTKEIPMHSVMELNPEIHKYNCWNRPNEYFYNEKIQAAMFDLNELNLPDYHVFRRVISPFGEIDGIEMHYVDKYTGNIKMIHPKGLRNININTNEYQLQNGIVIIWKSDWTPNIIAEKNMKITLEIQLLNNPDIDLRLQNMTINSA